MSETRHRILSAFRDLAIEYGYSAVSVRDIIVRADVARSTFYENFDNKGDGFREITRPILEPLADACLPHSDRAGIVWLLDHVREIPGAQSMLAEPARAFLAETLGELIEIRLQRLRSHATVTTEQPLQLVAAWIAEAAIGSVIVWLEDDHPVPAETVATFLQTAARDCAKSFTGG